MKELQEMEDQGPGGSSKSKVGTMLMLFPSMI